MWVRACWFVLERDSSWTRVRFCACLNRLACIMRNPFNRGFEPALKTQTLTRPEFWVCAEALIFSMSWNGQKSVNEADCQIGTGQSPRSCCWSKQKQILGTRLALETGDESNAGADERKCSAHFLFVLVTFFLVQRWALKSHLIDPSPHYNYRDTLRLRGQVSLREWSILHLIYRI